MHEGAPRAIPPPPPGKLWKNAETIFVLLEGGKLQILCICWHASSISQHWPRTSTSEMPCGCWGPGMGLAGASPQPLQHKPSRALRAPWQQTRYRDFVMWWTESSIIYLDWSDAVLPGTAWWVDVYQKVPSGQRHTQSPTAEWRIRLSFLTFLKLARAHNEAFVRCLFQGFFGYLSCQEWMHRR